MEQNAFNLVTQKVGEVLRGQGFEPAQGAGTEQDAQCATFTGEDIAYSILYRTEQKRFELRKCEMTDDGPDGKWKSVSAWLYDPDEDSQDQLQSIVEDFTDSVAGPKPKAAAMARQKKKRRKDDDNNVDAIFLFNRFAGVFPELKDEMNDERDSYDDIRSVTFARDKLLPKIEQVCSSGSDAGAANRCATLFNEMYAAGDLDVRSIITIVLLNGLSEKSIETIKPLFSEDLAKAFKSGSKMKGKKVRPEKKKKPSKIMASTLNDK